MTVDDSAVEESTGSSERWQLSRKPGSGAIPLDDDEDRHRQAGDDVESAQALRLVESEHVLGLALADDLHAARLDVGEVACEGQARLLHPRVGDRIVEVGLSRQDAQVEACELLAQQLPHLHRRRHDGGRRRLHQRLSFR
jgi:hypothetical protein